jgi:Flp pilus assembly protein TadG
MKHVCKSSQGSALVEMAITLPLIMLIMTGIFSFSIALSQKLILTEAVSAGGRTIAADADDTDPCTTATNAIYAAAPSLKSASITLTYTLNPTPLTSTTAVSYGSGTTKCPGASGAANANLVSGGNAEIQASYPCEISVYGKSLGSCTINSAIQEDVQ